MSGCCGRCDQGRQPCPHPDLCEQHDGVAWRALCDELAWLLWPVYLVAMLALAGWAWRVWPWL